MIRVTNRISIAEDELTESGERGLVAHVTVTDEADHAASFVVVETQSPSPEARP